MPNRKPQVRAVTTATMWMAMKGSAPTLWIQFKRNLVIYDLENNSGYDWNELRSLGWRIVKVRVVEVRETKKGK